jgi:hypothetical protein
VAFVNVSKVSAEEKLLWSGVLRRSVFDWVLYKGSGKHKLTWQRANRFIFGEYPIDGMGLNFVQVCGLFGWEPEYIRRLTKALTRDKIKKLETSKFKDQFDDSVVEVVNRTLNWEQAGAATPFLQPYHYSREYRETLRPRVVPRSPKRHVSFLPLMSRVALAVQ